MFKKISRWARYKRIKMIRSYKLNHTLPKYTHCKNCDTKLEGMYCHKCGQYALDTKQSFWKFIVQYFSNTYQTDGRALTTLWLLIFYPGFLSTQFVKGRITSYVHPMKLYLFCSIIFFALVFFLAPSSESLAKETDKITSSAQSPQRVDSIRGGNEGLGLDLQITKQVNSKIDTSTTNKIKELSDSTNSATENSTLENQYKKLLIFQAIANTSKQYLPIFMLLCLPFYGIILRLFFKKRYRNFLPHYVFAIHSSIFMMILMLVTGSAIYYFNHPFTFFLISLSIFTIYTIISTRVFYENNWFLTIIKSGFSLLLYSTICLLIISILLGVVLVYTIKELKYSLD